MPLTQFARSIRRGLVVALAVMAGAFSTVLSLNADILVTDNFGNQVLRYDQTNGAFLGVLVSNDPGQNGGLNGPIGLRLNGNGNLLVTSQFSDSILEYDLNTGAFLGTFTSPGQGGGLSQPADLHFGPNGNLLVANFGGNSLSQFTPSGTPLGPFTNGGPGIVGTSSFAIDSNNNVFVGSFNTGDIQRFDGATGTYLNTFASGLAGPSGLLFDGDGSLWVANLFSHTISHFSSSGSLLGTFFTGTDTFPSHIIVNPNDSSELLIALTGAAGIYRFGKNGTAFGKFAGGAEILVPGQMLVVSAIPEPGMAGLLVLGAVSLMGLRCGRRQSS